MLKDKWLPFRVTVGMKVRPVKTSKKDNDIVQRLKTI